MSAETLESLNKQISDLKDELHDLIIGGGSLEAVAEVQAALKVLRTEKLALLYKEDE
jgi:hypothetical protein